MECGSQPPALPPERRSVNPWLLALVVGLALLASVFYLKKTIQAIREPKASVRQQNLIDLYQGCLRYADKNQGRFPPDLETLKREGLLKSENRFALGSQLSQYHYFGNGLTMETAKHSTDVLVVEEKPCSVRLNGDASNSTPMYRVLQNNGETSWVGVQSTMPGINPVSLLDPRLGLMKGKSDGPGRPPPRALGPE